MQESGYKFDSDPRIKVFLTNALDNSPRKSEVLFNEIIASEADKATSLTLDEPVMVGVENPPYQQIVVVLQETIQLMAAIDQAIPGFPIK